MGGSCPECKAPVELGQQFCLECGAAIRPPRRRLSQSVRTVGGTRASQPGFPWIPFLAILAVVALGLALAFMGTGDEGGPSTGSTTDDDVGELSSTRDSEELPTLSTATTDACIPGAAADGSATTGSATTPGTIPTSSSPPPLQPGSGAGAVGADGSSTVPGTTIGGDTGSGASPVPCPTTPTPTVPTSTAPTTGTTTTDTNGSGSNETWPATKSGYTVVIASLGQATYTEDDAQVRAVEAQQHGLRSGVLDSNGFSSLTRDLWVVFSGIFDSEAEANAHLPEVRQAGYQGAYVRQIRP